MLTRRVRIQVVAFVVIALAGVSFLGARYVGLDRVVGDSGYAVSVDLPETGGIFPNAEVTYRGVPVGRVSSVDLTGDGVRVHLRIESDAARIPADVDAVVANRSAIGEQYLDLRPRTTDGPFLGDRDVVEAGAQDLPPKVEVLLRNSRDLVRSVPEEDLRTVVDEFYLASRGSADDLRRLLSTSQDLIRTADRNFLVTQGLIDNSATVLDTQERSADDIAAFSADLELLTRTLRDSDGDLRRLIETTPAAAREIETLVDTVGGPLGVLMSNLVSTAQVFGTNAAGVQDVLITLPRVMSVGWVLDGPRGLRVGAVPTFFAPLPCTEGYGGTDVRPGSDTTPGAPLNEDAGCRTRDGSTNVRGPGAAPPALPAVTPTNVTVPDDLADLMGAAR